VSRSRRTDPAGDRYVCLATFRRDGREVRTPVWIAGEGRRCWVFSEARAGKVKRIRANGRARIAACDYRGRVLGGWLDARARILRDPAEIAEAYAALRRKYGWQMRAADRLAKLAGRYDRRALLELELLDAAA
jgi:PPOX class probable F420-dependent enzyme